MLKNPRSGRAASTLAGGKSHTRTPTTGLASSALSGCAPPPTGPAELVEHTGGWRGVSWGSGGQPTRVGARFPRQGQPEQWRQPSCRITPPPGPEAASLLPSGNCHGRGPPHLELVRQDLVAHAVSLQAELVLPLLQLGLQLQQQLLNQEETAVRRGGGTQAEVTATTRRQAGGPEAGRTQRSSLWQGRHARIGDTACHARLKHLSGPVVSDCLNGREHPLSHWACPGGTQTKTRWGLGTGTPVRSSCPSTGAALPTAFQVVPAASPRSTPTPPWARLCPVLSAGSSPGWAVERPIPHVLTWQPRSVRPAL